MPAQIVEEEKPGRWACCLIGWFRIRVGYGPTREAAIEHAWAEWNMP